MKDALRAEQVAGRAAGEDPGFDGGTGPALGHTGAHAERSAQTEFADRGPTA